MRGGESPEGATRKSFWYDVFIHYRSVFCKLEFVIVVCKKNIVHLPSFFDQVLFRKCERQGLYT